MCPSVPVDFSLTDKARKRLHCTEEKNCRPQHLALEVHSMEVRNHIFQWLLTKVTKWTFVIRENCFLASCTSLQPCGISSIKTLNRSYAVNIWANTIDLLYYPCYTNWKCTVCVCVCGGADNGPCIKLIVCEINSQEMPFISLRRYVPRVNKLPFSSTAW